MKQYVINQFHFYGAFIAGDNFDIHDNHSVNIYQGQQSPTNTPTASTATVENVTPIVEHAPCPFLVPDKLTELGLYSLEQFETMFREAAESDAKTLAAFLKKYRQMGVLDFKGMDKKQIFAELRACFPTMKRYSYSNFIYYFWPFIICFAFVSFVQISRKKAALFVFHLFHLFLICLGASFREEAFFCIYLCTAFRPERCFRALRNTSTP